MALIKNAIAKDIVREAVVLDLGDLQRQGALIVQQAQAAAARVAADAQGERQRIIADASEKGYAEGLAKGLEEGRRRGQQEAMQAAVAQHGQQLSEIGAAWATTLSEFAAQRDSLIEHATRDVLSLAVLIAQRIVKRTVEIDPNVVVEQARSVLSVIVRPTELVIRVNPLDRPVLEQAMPGLLSSFALIRHVEVVDDATLGRGSCAAQMRGGDGRGEAAGVGGAIDASIRTQMDRIVELVLPVAATADGSRAETRGLVERLGVDTGNAEAHRRDARATEDGQDMQGDVSDAPATPPGPDERGEASW